MSKHTKYTVVFGLVLVLTCLTIAAVWAVPANPYVSNLICLNRPYSNQLTAMVTGNLDGTYHYLYTLVFAQTAFPGQNLTSFSVSNFNHMPFTNQWCDYSFTAAVSAESIYWYINVPVGKTINFSYDSPAFYDLADVTMDAGLPADGITLGMIPEPGSLAVVAFGLLGAGWLNIRRRR